MPYGKNDGDSKALKGRKVPIPPRRALLGLHMKRAHHEDMDDLQFANASWEGCW